MAFESLIDRLIPEGAVMAGSRPKVITEPGGTPGYHQTDALSRLVRGLEKFQQQQKTQQEEQMKKQEKRMDMYKTLRDSGYDPSRAYKAVMANEFPDVPGGETAEEKKKELDIKQTEANIEQTKAETDKIKTGSLQDRILAKVEAGDTLTSGEQKVYDEYIRKYGQKGSIEGIMEQVPEEEGAPAKKDDKVGWVYMTTPEGKTKHVHPDDVKKGLKKGWKKK